MNYLSHKSEIINCKTQNVHKAKLHLFHLVHAHLTQVPDKVCFVSDFANLFTALKVTRPRNRSLCIFAFYICANHAKLIASFSDLHNLSTSVNSTVSTINFTDLFMLISGISFSPNHMAEKSPTLSKEEMELENELLQEEHEVSDMSINTVETLSRFPGFRANDSPPPSICSEKRQRDESDSEPNERYKVPCTERFIEAISSDVREVNLTEDNQLSSPHNATVIDGPPLNWIKANAAGGSRQSAKMRPSECVLYSIEPHNLFIFYLLDLNPQESIFNASAINSNEMIHSWLVGTSGYAANRATSTPDLQGNLSGQKSPLHNAPPRALGFSGGEIDAYPAVRELNATQAQLLHRPGKLSRGRYRSTDGRQF